MISIKIADNIYEYDSLQEAYNDSIGDIGYPQMGDILILYYPQGNIFGIFQVSKVTDDKVFGNYYQYSIQTLALKADPREGRRTLDIIQLCRPNNFWKLYYRKF